MHAGYKNTMYQESSRLSSFTNTYNRQSRHAPADHVLPAYLNDQVMLQTPLNLSLLVVPAQ